MAYITFLALLTSIALSASFYTQLASATALSPSSFVPVPRQLADTQMITPDADLAQNNWLSRDGISPDAHQLIDAIQSVDVHGLSPETYQLSEIKSSVDRLIRHITLRRLAGTANLQSSISHFKKLRFELNSLLDSNFIRLAEDLGQGAIDGRKLQKRLYREPPQIDAFELLLSVINGQRSVSDALSSVTPSHPGYQRLTNTMRKLLDEQASGIKRTRVFTHTETQSNSVNDDRHYLWNRLFETGDLPTDADAIDDPLLTLTNALKSFQARHGFEPHGKADKKTRVALNATVSDDIDAVKMSLERFRWLPRDLGERHIFINIPDYRMNLVDGNRTTLTMPTVVGKYQHQTPAFSRDMSYMEYNPTWTVPRRIAREKLIPKERTTPGYLQAKGFEFLEFIDGKMVKVPTNSVTASDFDATIFPYTLRQHSGPANALGRMKFMMPNKWAIYLHDTPTKRLFSLNERAHSHGCIRLSDPAALAQALMLGDGYDQRAIDQSLQSNRTHRIVFRQPIPTHLVYMTSWVDENNRLQKRADVYNNDEALLDAFRNSHTFHGNNTDHLPTETDMQANNLAHE